MEPEPGPDRGVGICVSGGGLRAASFGLGVLQELQRSRGLVRGASSARWLSAVSGGSYIAGAITLVNAGSRARYADGGPVGGEDLPDSIGPYEQGSPEVAHLLRHSRYLIEDGGLKTAARVGVLLVAGALTMLVLVVAFGGFLGFISAISVVYQLALPFRSSDLASTELIRWIFALIGPLAYLTYTASLGTVRVRAWRSGPHRVLANTVLVALFLVVAAAVFFSAPYFAVPVYRIPVLSSPLWITEHWVPVGLGALVVVAAIGALHALGGVGHLRVLRTASRILSTAVVRVIPYIVAVVLVSWSFDFFYIRLIGFLSGTSGEAFSDTATFFVVAVVYAALVIASPLPGLISPHRPYRTLVSRCFAAVRTDGGADAEQARRPDEISLESLRPGQGDERYPELVVCAAANVTDTGAAPAGSRVLPLEITGTAVSIPTDPSAHVAASDLEHMRTPTHGYGITPPRPSMSLSCAVAIAGAAVSPAMGRMSRPTLRPLLATFNVRLGVWLPNPLSPEARLWVRERQSKRFTVGISQLLLEFFGRHSSRFPMIYASDGGHYENLGLLALIRRRCTEIWIIDAQADPDGNASELVRSILLSEAEQGCRFTLPVEVFREKDADGKPVTVVAHGNVAYKDGTQASVHVVRLGITSAHSGIVDEYQRLDPGFPFHTTVRQVYSADRFDAYRRLGVESATIMITQLEGAAEQ